jgi:nucleoside 2-deoxyribosyltransferase
VTPSPVIYLASPYSHEDEDIKSRRHRKVCLAAAQLIKQGAVVFSPVAHSHPIALYGNAPGDWQTWKHQCLTLLDRCDVMLVLMLDGWQQSTGIKAEATHCLNTHKTIIYSDFASLALFDFAKIDHGTGQPAKIAIP